MYKNLIKVAFSSGGDTSAYRCIMLVNPNACIKNSSKKLAPRISTKQEMFLIILTISNKCYTSLQQFLSCAKILRGKKTRFWHLV